jgi:hypothetical protein
MIRDVLAESAKTHRWEDHIRSRCGDAAEALILESHRKALYEGGRISDRLAESYANWVETERA